MTRIFRAALAALIVLSAVSMGRAGERGTLRVEAFYLNPTSDLGNMVEADEAAGLGGSYEWKLNELFGVAAGIALARYDIDVLTEEASATLTELDALTATVEVLFHPAPENNVDLYFGVGGAYVLYDDASLRTVLGFGSDREVPVDDDPTWTGRIGVDIFFDEPHRWALNFDLRYVQTEADIRTVGAVNINPVSVGVGFSRRF